MAGHLVLFACAGAPKVGADALSAATGRTCGRVHETLCLADAATVARALAAPDTLMACGQETVRLTALALEGGASTPRSVDIRDRAGHGGVAKEAETLGVPLLAEIPLHLSIRVASDGGAPVVASKPGSPQAEAFRALARKLVEMGHA